MVKLRASISLVYLSFTLLILAQEKTVLSTQFNRYDFPKDLLFGAGSSAYQVEGAAFEDGRKASIWDTIDHAYGATYGEVACDQYHKYKEDVQLMVETGLDAYRLSISWSRLIPNGRGPINPKGLEYYNNLINELISHGIQPQVTLIHMDFPQVLEDEYGGFISPQFIDDFIAYAEICFREFGDRVKYWTTINEANVFILGGYDVGFLPPARCSSPFGSNCTKGNSTIEPYLATHNVLLAHAAIVRLYKEKYQAKQHGFVGFGLFCSHFVPSTQKEEDVIAAERVYDLWVGWFMHPLTYGDYPEILKKKAGTQIPSFTKNESKLVKGAFDFIGINYYSVISIKHNSNTTFMEPRDYFANMEAKLLPYNDSSDSPDPTGVPSGKPFPILSWGIQGVLEHFKKAYNNPPIHILENGQVQRYNVSVNDQLRMKYLQANIKGLLDAVRNGSNTKGYFVWSFLDMFELFFGYKQSFGLYYVDLDDPNLSRYPKQSQLWYSRFLKGENVTIDDEDFQEENIHTIHKIRSLDVDKQNLVS